MKPRGIPAQPPHTVVVVGRFAETSEGALALLTAEHAHRLATPTRATSGAAADGLRHTPRAELEAAIAAGSGEVVAHDVVGGELICTMRSALAAVRATGKTCVLRLDGPAAEAAYTAGLEATFVHIGTRSSDALEARLLASGMSGAELDLQLALAAHEADLVQRLPDMFAHTLVEADTVAATAELLRPLVSPPAPPVALVGPAGVGKSTLIGKLLADCPERFALPTLTTSRGAAPEVRAQLEAAAAAGEALLLDNELDDGELTAVSRAELDALARAGKTCLLEVGLAGARDVQLANVGASLVLIAPASLEQLEARLRATWPAPASEAALKRVLRSARAALTAAAEPTLFDAVIVNKDLDRAYGQLRHRLTGAAQPVVLCGPSGVGKGTLISLLLKTSQAQFAFCVSHTTRAPRPGEIDGVHYHFTTVEAMEGAISRGEFVEHARVHGNYYGTSYAAVEAVSRAGKSCVLDIDVQGARAVRASSLGALSIFIAPPSLDELERRLRGRGTEAEDKVQLRLANARAEVAASAEPGLFDHVLVNDDLTASFCRLRELLTGMAPPILVCGPSGVGKGTLIGKLLDDFPDDFGFSVSHSTRAPRPGEVDGVHYHFTTVEAMEGAISRGEFVEHARVHGNYYGTSVAAVEAVTRLGKSCVLDLDVQGARAVKDSALGAVFIFIAPPSLAELERRLRGRGTEAEDKVQLRLANARAEVAARDEPGFFDHVLVNDDLEQTYAALKQTVARYRELHLGQPFVARRLELLTADLPPPIPPGEPCTAACQIGNTALSLRACYVSDVGLVARCAGLHRLELSHNKLTDLAPLSALRYLLSLDASHNQLTNRGALFEPPLSLQELNLSHNQLTSASAASAHRELRVLDLSHNALVSTDGLGALEALNELYLRSNAIERISSLDNAPFLHTLDLAGNKIARAHGLEALARLTALDLSSNQLTSLSGLEQCESLMDLTATDNLIGSTDEAVHLGSLRLLRTLDLAGNPAAEGGADKASYRLHLAQQLPSLVTLDGDEVSAEEKVGAAWHFGAADAELRKIREKHLPPEGAIARVSLSA